MLSDQPETVLVAACMLGIITNLKAELLAERLSKSVNREMPRFPKFPGELKVT
jgi:hypothetical protein